MRHTVASLLLLLFITKATAASIVLEKTDATVWHNQQIIRGHLTGFHASLVTIYQNNSSFQVSTDQHGHFAITMVLNENVSTIYAAARDGNITIRSDTLRLTLGYKPFPIIGASASIEDATVKLRSYRIEDPTGARLTYTWKVAPGNPATVQMPQLSDSVATITIPSEYGEYFFTVYASDGTMTDSAKTIVMRTAQGLRSFDINNDKAAWINQAVIYQVTPYIFTHNRKYVDIEDKLAELATLGVNTLYLQPVLKSDRGGQGYDVIDFFSLRPDLGSEADLAALIKKAKNLGMRVLFDMVPNHTSIRHPYAKDKMLHREGSHYSAFYQIRKDTAEYAKHYHQHSDGFIYYFWSELVNLDYNNEEVQRWMLEACKHWIRKFDIDGYRFDAVWGVNARTPSFGKRLQLELKSLKPDLLLIAEDKAATATPYRLGFDAAYDWDKSEDWVSKWAWQYEYDEEHRNTIFNHPLPGERKLLMSRALFSDGDSIGIRLRYLENNDLHRFISNHSRDVTKMAATLLMTLNGLPMLYNGQETGFRLFPYTSGPIYDKERSIRSYDPNLFDFYKTLCHIRLNNPALTKGNMREIALNNAPAAIAFHRKSDSQDVVVLMNMGADRLQAAMKVDFGYFNDGNSTVFLDLINGDTVLAQKQANGYVITVEPYTTRVLSLIRNVAENPKHSEKLKVVPNPGTGKFTIHYTMLSQGRLNIRICDANGKVLLALQRYLPAGDATIPIQLTTAASGTCYIKTDDGKKISTTGVLMIRN